MSAFVPLRVRSHGSLLYGMASPEALVERASALGYGALALTDRDNLYLAIRFYQKARAEGLTPLLGAELGAAPHGALLLPLDRRGYANLCRLLTLRHLDPAFDPVSALGELWRGLHVIVEAPGLAASLLAAGVPAARGVAGAPGAAVPPGGGGGVPEAADEALTNNAALVARCRLTLELGTPIFPHAPVPAGETGPGYLMRLGRAGIERRYGANRSHGTNGAAHGGAVARAQ